MTGHDDFMDGLERAIEQSITRDEEGDYTLNTADVADSVVDYLEQQGLIVFYSEN